MNLLIQHKNLLPLLILAQLCLDTIIQVLPADSGLNFTLFNYLAFAFVTACISIYFWFRKFYKKAVLITLVVGLTGALNFTVTTYRFNIGSIALEGISLMIAIIYFILNFSALKAKYVGDEVIELPPDRENILKFREKYNHLSIQELEEISRDTRFLQEAKIAARQLLEERK